METGAARHFTYQKVTKFLCGDQLPPSGRRADRSWKLTFCARVDSIFNFFFSQRPKHLIITSQLQAPRANFSTEYAIHALAKAWLFWVVCSSTTETVSKVRTEHQGGGKPVHIKMTLFGLYLIHYQPHLSIFESFWFNEESKIWNRACDLKRIADPKSSSNDPVFNLLLHYKSKWFKKE
jgi:hypothetical protein